MMSSRRNTIRLVVVGNNKVGRTRPPFYQRYVLIAGVVSFPFLYMTWISIDDRMRREEFWRNRYDPYEAYYKNEGDKVVKKQ